MTREEPPGNPRLLALEQADGLYALECYARGECDRGDAGDPWQTGTATLLGDSTTPSSRWYSGASSGVTVAAIGPSAPVMTADVFVRISICGDGVVQDGEECDAGAGNESGCCAACRFVADGTVCGPNVPPCLITQCRAGVCETSRATDACLIDAVCVSPGGADPENPCRRCDPTRSADAWSPDVSPARLGVRCQLDRTEDALQNTACRRRLMRQLAKQLRQRRGAVDRQLTAAVVGRRATVSLRRARQLARTVARAGRGGCSVERLASEVEVLLAQLAAMAQVAPQRKARQTSG